jgi:hypothetical protein
MSQYAIASIFSFNRIDINHKDLRGFTISNWLSGGTVGWNESMNTYFLALDMSGDDPEWLFGKSYREIESFNQLRELACRVLNLKSPDALSFNSGSIVMLSNDRNYNQSYADAPEYVEQINSNYPTLDRIWGNNTMNRYSFHEEYLIRGLHPKKSPT